MSASQSIWWGGLAAMVGGALFLVGSVIFVVGHPFLYFVGLPVRDYPVIYVICGVSFAVALLLVPVGMLGFHIMQRRNYLLMGRAGFWATTVGSLMVASGGAIFFTLGEAGDFLQATPPLIWVVSGLLGSAVGIISLVVGFALYGLATLQAKVLPRWCGVAFIAALPAGLAASVLCNLLFFATNYDPFLYFTWVSMFMVLGLAWLALGYALWERRAEQTVHQSPRVR